MNPLFLSSFLGVSATISLLVYILYGFNPYNKKSLKYGYCPPGLNNLGNTCYINALLQGLASCSSLISWLEDFSLSCENRPRPTTKNILISSLLKTLQVLASNHHQISSLSPTEFIDALFMNRWIVTSNQQDVHELFLIILDIIHKEEIKCTTSRLLSMNDIKTLLQESKISIFDKSMNTFPIQKKLPFLGSYAIQLNCLNCRFQNPIYFENFCCISLGIPQSGLCNNLTIEDLFRQFLKGEFVKRNECNKCNSSKNQSKHKMLFTKKLKFQKLPNCLCIHIQRSEWHKSYGLIKREEYVKFSDVLDIEPFTHWTNISNSLLKRKYKYKLCAVIVHLGDNFSGHFITYRQFSPTCQSNLLSNTWIWTSDSAVKKVSFEEVLTAKAYMLFYERYS